MSDDETAEKKTIEDFVEDRTALANLEAPTARFMRGSERDFAYQQERALDYALDMIGHLLVRIEKLETQQR